LAWDEVSAENQYQFETVCDLSPDRAFDRRWAMTLFQQGLRRLQCEFTEAGKAEGFDELKRFLSESTTAQGCVGSAHRVKMTPAAVAVAVHRLRKRYGELVRGEIAHTVSNLSEIEDEMRYLIALVSG